MQYPWAPTYVMWVVECGIGTTYSFIDVNGRLWNKEHFLSRCHLFLIVICLLVVICPLVICPLVLLGARLWQQQQRNVGENSLWNDLGQAQEDLVRLVVKHSSTSHQSRSTWRFLDEVKADNSDAGPEQCNG